jgi:hypothetical protein
MFDRLREISCLNEYLEMNKVCSQTIQWSSSTLCDIVWLEYLLFCVQGEMSSLLWWISLTTSRISFYKFEVREELCDDLRECCCWVWRVFFASL